MTLSFPSMSLRDALSDTSSESVSGMARFIALYSALCVAGSLALQYQVGLEPCPLCIAQRLCFVAMLVLSLPLALSSPRRSLANGLGIVGLALVPAVFLVGLAGLGVVIYHLWLLTLSGADASCSVAVNFFLMDLSALFPAWLQFMFTGLGSCKPESVYELFTLPVLLAFSSTGYALSVMASVSGLAAGARLLLGALKREAV